jgi:hypothetical protein
MVFKLESAGEESRWTIKNEAGEAVGEGQRFATGYLVTEYSTQNVVKRFRFIDALNEVFGPGHTFQNMPPRP